jgi:hypothetical protein
MEAEDYEEPMVAIPLHQAQTDDVNYSQVFCYKILHQRTNRRDRYRRSNRYLKIVRHSHPDATGPPFPRPLTSPAPCFNCHRLFTGPPVFMPMRMLDGVPEEDLNFCCGPCANTYLHTNMKDGALATRAAHLLEYMQRVHGFRGSKLGFAPHFSELQRYMGDLTDEQFDAICGKPDLTTAILRRPFIPTEVVVEWQCVGDGGSLDPSHWPRPAAPDAAPTVAPAAAPAAPDVFPRHLPMPGDAATAVLADVMQATAPPTDHHHRWDVTDLKQPSWDAIHRRQMSLPPLAQSEGLYAQFLEARAAEEAAAAEKGLVLAPLPTHAATARGGRGSGNGRKAAGAKVQGQGQGHRGVKATQALPPGEGQGVAAPMVGNAIPVGPGLEIVPCFDAAAAAAAGIATSATPGDGTPVVPAPGTGKGARSRGSQGGGSRRKTAVVGVGTGSDAGSGGVVGSGSPNPPALVAEEHSGAQTAPAPPPVPLSGLSALLIPRKTPTTRKRKASAVAAP